MTFDLDIWQGSLFLTLSRSTLYVKVTGQGLRSQKENVPYLAESKTVKPAAKWSVQPQVRAFLFIL